MCYGLCFVSFFSCLLLVFVFKANQFMYSFFVCVRFLDFKICWLVYLSCLFVFHFVGSKNYEIMRFHCAGHYL